MITSTQIDITKPNDIINYEKLMNNPDIKILMEQYGTDREGNAYCIIKYEDTKPYSKTTSYRQCAPYRI